MLVSKLLDVLGQSCMLSKLKIQQKKAILHVYYVKYNDLTKEAFKQHSFLQLVDLFLLNQAVFVKTRRGRPR